MYHRINNKRDVLGLSVSPEYFDRQLAFLSSRFRVISLADAVDMIEAGIPKGEYAVITFDDGYRDNYDFAFPILRRYDAPATIFLTVNAVESGSFFWSDFDAAILSSKEEILDLSNFGITPLRIDSLKRKEEAICHLHSSLKLVPDEIRRAVVADVVATCPVGDDKERTMLSWSEVREMAASGLVTIGSHTMSHPILTRMSFEDAQDEILQSKEILEEKLDTPINLFAYPNGTASDFNEELKNVVKRTGYCAACTTVHGIAAQGMDPYELPRVDVTYGMCQGIGGRFSSAMFEAALYR